jgi:hypothetical protein
MQGAGRDNDPLGVDHDISRDALLKRPGHSALSIPRSPLAPDAHSTLLPSYLVKDNPLNMQTLDKLRASFSSSRQPTRSRPLLLSRRTA